eukprot:6871210-Prorocentrum_lima.AAC.1
MDARQRKGTREARVVDGKTETTGLKRDGHVDAWRRRSPSCARSRYTSGEDDSDAQIERQIVAR